MQLLAISLLEISRLGSITDLVQYQTKYLFILLILNIYSVQFSSYILLR